MMVQSLADSDHLMADVAAGELHAFAQIYEAHRSLVTAMVKRVLGDGDSAIDDAVQTTFVKVWRSASRYRPGNVSGFIARIAHNTALDVLRSRRDVPTELSALDARAAGDAFDTMFFASIERRALRSAVKLLPSRERLPIELGFFGGLTHAEIAVRTEVPLGTVKTRIRSGLHRLRRSLSPVLLEDLAVAK